MNKSIVLLVTITSLSNVVNANDLDVFLEYHSKGCVLLSLSKLGLTLDDELSKNTANRIQSECQKTFNNAVLYTKKFDLDKKVDGSTKIGKAFNLAKDNFFTGCTIYETKNENYPMSILKDRNSAQFKHIYKKCLSVMKNGILAMKEIKPIYK